MLNQCFSCPHILSETLGPETPIVGCFFHWKQAVRRQLLKLHFDTSTVQRLMAPGIVDVLTVIPPREIETYRLPFIRAQFHADDAQAHSKLELFFQYFKRTWMSQFYPTDWNISMFRANRAFIAHRTNNPLEPYNNRLNHLFNTHHPRIKVFASEFRRETELIVQDYVNNIHGRS